MARDFYADMAQIERLKKIGRMSDRSIPPYQQTMESRDPSYRDMATDAIGAALQRIGFGSGGRQVAQRKAEDIMAGLDWTPVGDALDIADNPKDPMNLAILAGPLAKAAPLKKLSEANFLKEGKAHADEIWSKTGWEESGAGDWRWEIPDNAMKVKTPTGKSIMGRQKLEDIIEHPNLFINYPALKQVEVTWRPLPPDTTGGIDPSTGNMVLNSLLPHLPKEMKKTILHEIQHLVQMMENHSGGANPFAMNTAQGAQLRKQIIDDTARLEDLAKRMKASGTSDPGKLDQLRSAIGVNRTLLSEADTDQKLQYLAKSGEADARNVEYRMDDTDAKLKAMRPEKTADIHNKYRYR